MSETITLLSNALVRIFSVLDLFCMDTHFLWASAPVWPEPPEP
jgi:hypothetical protein